MTAIPKPEKKGPKPPKRIARKKRPAPLRRRDSRGLLRKLADDLMSLYVRHKAGWRCWVCGSKRYEEMQMAHLIGKKAHPAGRYKEQNVRCLCCRCHRKYTDRPEDWRAYLDWKIGEGAFQRLFDVVRVRGGRNDYPLEIIYWERKLRARDDLEKVQERYDKLHARAVKLGVLT